MALMGHPGEAGKARRDTPSGPVRGRTIAQRIRAVAVPVRDAEPIGTALMASLGILYPTWSPGSSGGGPGGGRVTQSTGAGIVGRDPRRTGALQDFHGAGARRNLLQGTVGIQGGPSSMPAYPSTGSNTAPSLQNSLAGMSLPQVLTNPAVR